jgi:hypothetical protein
MITNTFSWSLGSCLNKSLNTVEPPVPPHHPGDFTAFPPRHHSVLSRHSACRSPIFPSPPLSQSATALPNALKTHHLPLIGLIGRDRPQTISNQGESTSDRFLKSLPRARTQLKTQTHSVYKKHIASLLITPFAKATNRRKYLQ